MKRNFLRILALSLFLNLGNAQEDALPVSTVYATQGNVARRQSLDEAEMQAAVQAAREEKALKAAMATYSQPRQVITTPAQFLAANPPRVPAAADGEGDLSGVVVKKEEEVPEFEPVPGTNGPGASSPDPAPVRTALPVKAGFFEKLKVKNRRKDSGFAENPYVLEQPAAQESISNTVGGASGVSEHSSKKDPFGGIFKRGKSSPAPASVPPGEVVGTPSAITTAPEEMSLGSGPREANTDIVAAPAVTGTGAPAPTGTSIFVPRSGGTLSGEPASLKSTADADVGGVLVSIRQGTRVGILSERGGIATIQLPDHRIGKIKASTLAR